MKLNRIKYFLFASMLALGTTSCEEFLDRPAEDNYNAGNFYQNDEQCYQGVNYLYNSPWYDFQRGFIKVGEVLSGQYVLGQFPLYGVYRQWHGCRLGKHVLFLMGCIGSCQYSLG